MTLATPQHGIAIPTTLPLPTSAQHGHGPGLGEIYDGGDDHGTLYLITQPPEAGTLADELDRHHLSADEVRELGAGIARALLPAHRRGWTHGALEADTVVLGPERVTVAGLGVGEWLAHWAQVEDHPRHPAPEQLAEREISPATDVFALGELLAEAAEPLPRSDPLVALLRRMRADDPADRPSTEEVLRLLGAPTNPPSPAPTGQRVVVLRRPRATERAAPTIAALGGLAVAAALALGTFLVHPSDAAPESVAGGATVATSSADPDLPGPLPLLIPPMVRQALLEQRTEATRVRSTVTPAPRTEAVAAASSRTVTPSRETRDVSVRETSGSGSSTVRDRTTTDGTAVDRTATRNNKTSPATGSARSRAATGGSGTGSVTRTGTKAPVTDNGTGNNTGGAGTSNSNAGTGTSNSNAGTGAGGSSNTAGTGTGAQPTTKAPVVVKSGDPTAVHHPGPTAHKRSRTSVVKPPVTKAPVTKPLVATPAPAATAPVTRPALPTVTVTPDPDADATDG
ncbi:hypothetical protein LQ327_19520 [Actinomycetospora endophytica]|uniref:Protein kinase domain-containing protein n=1 Tax=Actinomycetospora endophytica TaxID=2291215 RepID=A0ABS8PBB8_9PSEU|nr:hypothetical protein [Actinomycetospora endophytica]MCD2195563.1 hypothetical protein [Actinomycetospora endophytica]